VPDRVALESNGFKEQTRMRMDSGAGVAAAARPRCVSPGSGGDETAGSRKISRALPLYVQHYFEHPENGQK